jgi:AcrR family transcriptional regulator
MNDSRLGAVADVKGEVSKAPTKAQAKSHATRTRIVRHAYELFCELGYKGTTMDLIADRSGVAVQTVYFNYRTKDILLQAVHEWIVLGDDPTPPPLQDWNLAAMREPDARDVISRMVAGLASIEARVARMIPVYHSVAQEPAGQVYRRSEELRREGMREVVDALAGKTPLVPALTRDRAADLIFFLTGPESYRALVLGAGWPHDEWVAWTSRTLCRDLFGDPPRSSGG